METYGAHQLLEMPGNALWDKRSAEARTKQRNGP